MNYSKLLKNKINSKKAIIGIVGMGYVGLPLATLIAKKGFNLFCFDKDITRVNLLKKRVSYFVNIPNKELNHFKKKTYIFSNLDKISECDIIILCLPTPLNKYNKPDISHIRDTINKIKSKLKKGQLIILESTSFPGTTREEVCEKINSKFNFGKDFFVTFSSERINPGMNERNIHNVPKVISGYSQSCLDKINYFYRNFFLKLIPAKSLEIAEFSKLLENIYRSVNIGFINEMKFVADKFNLDIFEILSISNTKPYGFKRFNPGPGVGGHCIPIDPQYLYWKSKAKGLSPKFIKLSADINIKVTKFIYKKIIKQMKAIKKTKKNFKVLVLGIAYKKNLDDDRESASIRLIEYMLKDKFKTVEYSDPYVSKYIFASNLKKKSIKINALTLKKFDLIVLATDHDKFNYNLIAKNSKFIIDCRGKYKLSEKVVRG